MRNQTAIAGVLTLLLAASPAQAGEVFTGMFVHDVDLPTSLSGQEAGLDVQLGWRGDRIEALGFIGRPSPHVFGSVNLAGATNFVAAGISWRIGRKFYLRPGIGMAVHDGPSSSEATPDRIDFGSRVLFAPELGVGIVLDERASIEASWVHLSHATLFDAQNPGSDSLGVRLNFGF